MKEYKLFSKFITGTQFADKIEFTDKTILFLDENDNIMGCYPIESTAFELIMDKKVDLFKNV